MGLVAVGGQIWVFRCNTVILFSVRSARFTINMLIAIIFGTLSPLMYLLAWINFYLCTLPERHPGNDTGLPRCWSELVHVLRTVLDVLLSLQVATYVDSTFRGRVIYGYLVVYAAAWPLLRPFSWQ